VTKTVGQVLGEGQEVIKSLTGLDLSTLVASIAGNAVTGSSTGTNHTA
jgi:flotillin